MNMTNRNGFGPLNYLNNRVLGYYMPKHHAFKRTTTNLFWFRAHYKGRNYWLIPGIDWDERFDPRE
jgi:hypothetical protein